ncbi:MAG TPA: glycosyltransferase [Bacteroidales bacterium]|nr:glycosyltransferase [Bacteroidales bacterium]
MKKVKIIGTSHPYRGGLAAFNEHLAFELQSQGFVVEIETFTLQYPGFLFPGKTQYADWPAPENISIKRTVNSVSPLNWIRVGKSIASENVDFVIFKYWLPFLAPCFGTIARQIKSRSGTQVIAILDNIIPHEKRIGDLALTRYFVKPVDGFIAMSKSVLSDLENFDKTSPRLYSPHPLFTNFGRPVSKVEAIRNLKLDPGFSYMLFFGFIRDYKGLDLLVEAFSDKRLRDRKIKLLVAGEFYTNSKKYFDLIDLYHLKDDIIVYPEFIPDKKVADWFCAADIIVQPYKSATQSGVTQIGYHFDKPMLVTDVGGLPEIVPHMKGGYVVQPHPQDIADAILDFFDNNREQSFTEGIRKEKTRFGWDTMVKNISLLIDQIENQ